MNETLKEIANKHEITEEKITEILTQMKLKNPEKPTKRQLEGFEKVCILVKEEKPISEAIAIAILETKQGQAETQTEIPREIEKLGELLHEQGRKAARTALSNIAQLPLREYQRMEDSFYEGFYAEVIEILQDPQFEQQFFDVITGEDEGKLKLLNGTDTTTALPNVSSSTS